MGNQKRPNLGGGSLLSQHQGHSSVHFRPGQILMGMHTTANFADKFPKFLAHKLINW